MFDLEKQLCNWPAMVAGCPPGSASDNGIGKSQGIDRHYIYCLEIHFDVISSQIYFSLVSSLELILLASDCFVSFIHILRYLWPLHTYCHADQLINESRPQY